MNRKPRGMTSLRHANMGNDTKKYSLHLIFTFYPNRHISCKIFPCHCSSIKKMIPHDVRVAGRLKKFFGFSAKFEALKIFFIHSIISKFQLQRGALGACDFQMPCGVGHKPSLHCWIVVEKAKITFVSIHIIANQNSHHDDKSTL